MGSEEKSLMEHIMLVLQQNDMRRLMENIVMNIQLLLQWLMI